MLPRKYRLMSSIFGVVLITVATILVLSGNTYEPFDTNHIYICLGDSILNNEKYVLINKSVISILSTHLHIYNGAQDNAKVQDIVEQINNIPLEHIESENVSVILSIGGNNLIQMEDIDAVYKKYIPTINYILKHILKGNGQIYILNLYYPHDPSMKIFYPLITQWNQLINPLGSNTKIHIVDVSHTLTSKNDFTQIIEPSESGSQAIATTILSSISNKLV
jgi:hypothetical protein